MEILLAEMHPLIILLKLEMVIINTASVVEHDCIIPDGVHVAPGAVLCGGVKVNNNTLIGANSVINQNITIGENVIIGSGSVVINDIPNGLKVAGNPVKIRLKQ